jgi:hypothetical protein
VFPNAQHKCLECQQVGVDGKGPLPFPLLLALVAGRCVERAPLFESAVCCHLAHALFAVLAFSSLGHTTRALWCHNADVFNCGQKLCGNFFHVACLA